ncbi:hypothetical protein C4572_00630 [Candidatus Parcubacteria bacterium]|nr:MAG: hypothetical protein C4572_00630 [Candidatus Parcubacteria bacterium]
MFEPVVYCRCGNIREYGGNWQITKRDFKEVLKPLMGKGSVVPTDKCPICKCADMGEILVSLKNL